MNIPNELSELYLRKGKDISIWNFCEEIMDNFGNIEEDKDVYINEKFMYKYETKNNILYLCYNNIWSLFSEKFNLKYEHIQFITMLYIKKNTVLTLIKHIFFRNNNYDN